MLIAQCFRYRHESSLTGSSGGPSCFAGAGLGSSVVISIGLAYRCKAKVIIFLRRLFVFLHPVL